MPFETFAAYPPVDTELVDRIVSKLKSQGIFDQFRKDCLADVDTKPAYQNLQQRVNGTVASFLATQTWQQDLNKTQLRESLRRHVQQGFLEVGVDRIVDQVVNPKIIPVFMPKVEDVVYDCLGVEKPQNQPPPTISASFLTTAPPLPKKDNSVKKSLIDLLPKDLDPVSPESDNLSAGTPTKDERNNNDSSPKYDKEDSQLSGISELSSHMGDSFKENQADSNTVRSITSPRGTPTELQFDNFTNLSEKIRQAEMSHGQVTDPHIDVKLEDETNASSEVLPSDNNEPSSKKEENGLKQDENINEDVNLETVSNNSLSTFEDSKNFTPKKFPRDDTCTSFSEDSMTSSGFSNKGKIINNISKPSLDSENSINHLEQEEKSSAPKENIIQKVNEDSLAGEEESVVKPDSTNVDENKELKKYDEKERRDRDSSASSKVSRSSDKHKTSDSKHRSSHDKKDEKDKKDDSKSSKEKGSHRDEKDRTSKDDRDRSRHKDDKYHSNKEKHREKDRSNDRSKENDKKSNKQDSKENSEKDKKNDKDHNDKEKSSKDKYDKDRSGRSRHDKDKDRSDRDKREREKIEKEKKDKEKHEKDKAKTEKEREEQNKEKIRHDKEKHEKIKHEKDPKHEKDSKTEKDKEKNRNSDEKKDDKKKDSRKHEKSSHSSSSKKGDNQKYEDRDKKLKSGESSSRHKQNGEKSKSEEEKKERKRKGERCSDEIKSKEARRSSDRDSSGGKGGNSHRTSNSENRSGSSRESAGHGDKKSKNSGTEGTTDCIEQDEQPSDEIDGPSEVERIITQLNSSIEESQNAEIQNAEIEKEILPDEVPVKKPKIANNIFEIRKIMQARKNIDRKFRHDLMKSRKECERDITPKASEKEEPSSPEPIKDSNIPEENKENIKTQRVEKVRVLSKNSNTKAKFYGFQQCEIDISYNNYINCCKHFDLTAKKAEKLDNLKITPSMGDNEELLDNNLNNLKPEIKSLEKNSTSENQSKTIENIVNGKKCYVRLSRSDCSPSSSPEIFSPKKSEAQKKLKKSPALTFEKAARTEDLPVSKKVEQEGHRLGESDQSTTEQIGFSAKSPLPTRELPRKETSETPMKISNALKLIDSTNEIGLTAAMTEDVLDSIMMQSVFLDQEDYGDPDDSDYEENLKDTEIVAEVKEPTGAPLEKREVFSGSLKKSYDDVTKSENCSWPHTDQNMPANTQLKNVVDGLKGNKSDQSLIPHNVEPGTPKEGPGEKVARRNQRLSRSSQRYESTDLYKPRPVLPQNSKRVRSSRSVLSEDTHKMKSALSDFPVKRRGR